MQYFSVDTLIFKTEMFEYQTIYKLNVDQCDMFGILKQIKEIECTY